MGVAGLVQVPPDVDVLAFSFFWSWEIESRWASSLAFSLLPRVPSTDLISAEMVSRMFSRRVRSAEADVPVGSAVPNTVLNADSGELIVGRFPPLEPP